MFSQNVSFSCFLAEFLKKYFEPTVKRINVSIAFHEKLRQELEKIRRRLENELADLRDQLAERTSQLEDAQVQLVKREEELQMALNR